MKEKNLIILCIVFAILISLAFYKKSVKPQIPTTEEISDIIGPLISLGSLTEIIIRLGDGQSDDSDKPKNVHLAKEDDHWIVKTQFGVHAREQVITTLLEKLDRLKGELRSNRKEILTDYGINDEQAVHVQLHLQDADTIDIAVGIKKSGYKNNFVRIGGTSAVFVVNENLLAALGVRGEDEDQKLDTNKWIDKRITHLDPNDVVGVTIIEGDGTTERAVIDIKRELVDGKKQWRSAIAYDFGLSASKIKAMIEVFNNTYAQDVVAPDEEGVFDAPGWTGIFTLTNGDQVKIVRGEEKPEGKYYMKQEGVGYFYQIATSTFHSRKNRQGNIFANNPLKADEKKISEIEIRDLVNKKKFYALKKAPEETEAKDENTDEETKKKEDIWETPKGEVVELTKVRDIINKIKSIAVEAVLQPEVSVEDAMVIRIVREGESAEYTISRDLKLDTGKECQFLRVGENTQSYCVSKSTIISLQNILP